MVKNILDFYMYSNNSLLFRKSIPYQSLCKSQQVYNRNKNMNRLYFLRKFKFNKYILGNEIIKRLLKYHLQYQTIYIHHLSYRYMERIICCRTTYVKGRVTGLCIVTIFMSCSCFSFYNIHAVVQI